MESFKKSLNKSQLEAVIHKEGPLLIIAGAGSGKTRVIEYRTLNLISEGVDPSEILLLTFTRRAAEEMLERAAQHNEKCRGVEGGTFHSFAFRQLKKLVHANAISLPKNFTVIDESDSEDLVQMTIRSLGLDQKSGRIPKKDTAKKIISMAINKGLSLEEILEKYYPQFSEATEDIDEIRRVYSQKKEGKGYLDYDDLLISLRNVLKSESIRKSWFSKYKFIMMDEYQDTNKLQGEIGFYLGKPSGNIMAVGDDAQSIYGFRGATHANIMNFPRLFPDGKILKLEENYRSTQNILDLANSVLKKMESKYMKTLISATGLTGEKPQLLVFNNPYEEAEWIVQKIKTNKENGIDYQDQAVLFRSSFISIPLQSELARWGIPFKVFGGLKFYEMAHVKDLIAFLRVLINHKDELAWNRILGLLPKIGPKTIERIFEKIIRHKSLEELVESNDLEEFRSSSILPLFNVLIRASKNDLPVYEKIGVILDFYAPFLREKFDDWQMRSNDFEMLKEIVWKYDSLDDLVADFMLESPEKDSGGGNDVMTLSTIHSAKGLEWNAVFLLGATDGILPSKFSFSYAEEMEEEKRLLYVAVTRAKHKLFITMAKTGKSRGLNEWNRLSRFLDEPEILSAVNVLQFCDNDPRGIKKAADWDDDLFNLEYF